jgi:hypothetical protein
MALCRRECVAPGLGDGRDASKLVGLVEEDQSWSYDISFVYVDNAMMYILWE